MATTDEGNLIDILLIEPNQGDARLFTESFTDGKLANTFQTVSDGEEALAFLENQPPYEDTPTPDLILLEPRLPDKRGEAVLEDLAGEPTLTDIPVLVLTSSETGQRIVESRDLDVDGYLQKPVEPSDFLEFVHSIEEFWLAIVGAPAVDD